MSKMAEKLLSAIKKGNVDDIIPSIQEFSKSRVKNKAAFLMKISQECMRVGALEASEVALRPLLTSLKRSDGDKLLFNLLRACVSSKDFRMGKNLGSELIGRLDDDSALIDGTLQLYSTCLAKLKSTKELLVLARSRIMPRAKVSEKDSACKLYDIVRHHLWSLNNIECRRIALLATFERLSILGRPVLDVMNDIVAVGKNEPKNALDFYIDMLAYIHKNCDRSKLVHHAELAHLDAFHAILDHGLILAKKAHRLEDMAKICLLWTDQPEDNAVLITTATAFLVACQLLLGDFVKDGYITMLLAQQFKDATAVQIGIGALDMLRRVIAHVLPRMHTTPIAKHCVKCCELYYTLSQRASDKPSLSSIVDCLCLGARLRLDSMPSSDTKEAKQGYKFLSAAATVSGAQAKPLRTVAVVLFNCGGALYNAGRHHDALDPLVKGAEVWHKWTEVAGDGHESMKRKWEQVAACAVKCDDVDTSFEALKKALYWALKLGQEKSVIDKLIDIVPVSESMLESLGQLDDGVVFAVVESLIDRGDLVSAQWLCEQSHETQFAIMSAKISVIQHDNEAAIQRLKPIIEVTDDAEAHMWLGIASGDHEELSAALRLYNDDSDDLQLLSDAFYVFGCPELSVETLKKRAQAGTPELQCIYHSHSAVILTELLQVTQAETELESAYECVDSDEWLQQWWKNAGKLTGKCGIPMDSCHALAIARATVLLARGQHEAAQNCLIAFKNVSEDYLGSSHTASALYNRMMTACLSKAGHIDEALHVALRALRHANAASREAGSSVPDNQDLSCFDWSVSIAYVKHLAQVGDLYVLCGSHFTGEYYYKQGLKLSELMQSPSSTIEFLTRLSDLSRRRGKKENEWVDRAGDLDIAASFPMVSLNCMLASAQVHMSRGQLDDAETMLCNISDAAHDVPVVVARCQLELGCIYRDRGECDKAVDLWSSIDCDVLDMSDRATVALYVASTQLRDATVSWDGSEYQDVRESLEEVYVLCCDGSVSPHIHRSICQWLAWLTGHGDDRKTAAYIHESIDVSARHQMLAVLALRMDRLEADKSKMSIEDYNNAMKRCREMRRVFAFDRSMDIDARCSSLRRGWVAVSITLSPSGSHVMLARSECGAKHHVVCVAVSSDENPIARLVDDLHALQERSRQSAEASSLKNITTAAAKRNWWKQRQEMDDSLKAIMQTGGDMILGSDAGAVLGPYRNRVHLLMLDNTLQSFPIENTPNAINYTCTRVPSLPFAQWYSSNAKSGVDFTSTFYILNPSQDLSVTQDTLLPLFSKNKGWKGVVGETPTQDQVLSAVQDHDLFVYCGHSAGEQYLRASSLQQANGHAVALLMGCSSGALKQYGQFDPQGMALSYIMAGCPSIVANLWDVTDKDIDRFTAKLLHEWDGDLCEAVSDARSACKLLHLTGAAPVVYGTPMSITAEE